MRSILVLIALEILVLGCCSATDSVEGDSSIVSQVTITVVYDNVAFAETFKPDWGFACFIEGLEKSILFDAGAQADVLLHNMKLAHINPDRIQCLVISHDHGDHTQGLTGITGWENLKTAFLPKELTVPFTSLVYQPGLKRKVASLPVGLFPRVFLTGALGKAIIEQSLIIDTPQGLVLITGCSHPGIISILKKAKEILNKDIYLVLGGFHLLDHTAEQIKSIIDSFKSMGVRYCGASHCTGDKAMAAFREAYGDHFVELGAGRAITLDRDGLLLFGH